MLVMKKLERIRRFYIKMQQDHYLDPLNPEIELMLPFFSFCSNKSVDFCIFELCFVALLPLFVQPGIRTFCYYCSARICLPPPVEVTSFVAFCAPF